MRRTIHSLLRLGPSRPTAEPGLKELVLYFLKLGATGFGGPIALASYMERDLVEQRQWVSADEFRLGLALAQSSPGPLAAQLAIWIGFIRQGILGATLVGLAFVLPAFLIVLFLSVLYVRFGGLPWVRALFQGIGPAIVSIVFLAALRLLRKTLETKKFLWAIAFVLAFATAIFRAEISWLFIGSGVLALFVYCPPKLSDQRLWSSLALGPLSALTFGESSARLIQIFLFFVKSGTFIFGSGLVIVPFLYKGVVQDYGWLNEREFLDAVAIGMITPGPVLITVAFIGYLAAGFSGATLGSLGIFAPAYFFTVILGPYFKRYADSPRLKAFVAGITAAAVGSLAGSVWILAQGSLVNATSVAIALSSLLILWRFHIPEPAVVLVCGLIGLALF